MPGCFLNLYSSRRYSRVEWVDSVLRCNVDTPLGQCLARWEIRGQLGVSPKGIWNDLCQLALLGGGMKLSKWALRHFRGSPWKFCKVSLLFSEYDTAAWGGVIFLDGGVELSTSWEVLVRYVGYFSQAIQWFLFMFPITKGDFDASTLNHFWAHDSRFLVLKQYTEEPIIAHIPSNLFLFGKETNLSLLLLNCF